VAYTNTVIFPKVCKILRLGTAVSETIVCKPANKRALLTTRLLRVRNTLL
jgi:hypothetical protein